MFVHANLGRDFHNKFGALKTLSWKLFSVFIHQYVLNIMFHIEYQDKFRALEQNQNLTGCFFNWYPPKKLKYVKPRLAESTLTWIGLDTPNLA